MSVTISRAKSVSLNKKYVSLKGKYLYQGHKITEVIYALGAIAIVTFAFDIPHVPLICISPLLILTIVSFLYKVKSFLTTESILPKSFIENDDTVTMSFEITNDEVIVTKLGSDKKINFKLRKCVAIYDAGDDAFLEFADTRNDRLYMPSRQCYSRFGGVHPKVMDNAGFQEYKG